jgi:hypothetical protein
MDDVIRDWWYDPNDFKFVGDKKYTVSRLKKPQKLIAITLYHLYGENDATKFELSWVPLIHQIIKATIFNWEHILFDNIKSEVKNS